MGQMDARRWNKRYSIEKNIWENYPPKKILIQFEDYLPTGGIALDAASGWGASGQYLANKGFKVLSLDISSIGLSMAKKKYQASNLDFNGAVFDLINPWLPENYFDIILNFCFLERSSLAEYQKSLKPGGVLFFESFVKVRNNIKYSDHYLEEGELLSSFNQFEIIHYDQIDWTKRDGVSKRRVDQLVAIKPILTGDC